MWPLVHSQFSFTHVEDDDDEYESHLSFCVPASTRFTDIQRPCVSYSNTSAAVEEVALQTATRALHTVSPWTRPYHFHTDSELDPDCGLLWYSSLRREMDKESKLVVFVLSSKILDGSTLRDFINTRKVLHFHLSSHLLLIASYHQIVTIAPLQDEPALSFSQQLWTKVSLCPLPTIYGNTDPSIDLDHMHGTKHKTLCPNQLP